MSEFMRRNSHVLVDKLQELSGNTDVLAQYLSESFRIPPLRAATMAKLPPKEIVEKLIHMSTLMNRSMKEHAESERARFKTEYQPVFEVLIPHVKAFLEKHAAASNNESTDEFSALDIGSGYAIGTVTLALTFALPESKLLWYPSDWNAESGGSIVEQQTRGMLRHLLQESQESSVPLFMDKNEQPLYPGNAIELGGLKAEQFNGKCGFILGPDTSAEGRFAIQLSPNPKDCKSFKQQNITYQGEMTTHDAVLRMLRIRRKDEEFFQGLLERTRDLDILKHETWSNVEDLRGKCALVTCTNLLTCLGYRDPTAWQDTMQLAGDLLHVDGYLLQYDGVGFADFGDDVAMQSFANDKSLGLELAVSNVCDTLPSGRQRKVMLWRKL